MRKRAKTVKLLPELVKLAISMLEKGGDAEQVILDWVISAMTIIVLL